MRSAIVHDWLTSIGGGEKVLAEIHRLYPSPIHTLVANKKALKGTYFEECELYTSFLQKIPGCTTRYRYFLPLFPLAIEQFDLFGFDVVISSSHAVAKGVMTRHDQLHICYCHTPMRYAWDLYHEYVKELRGLKKGVATFFLHTLRNWDFNSHKRVDHFIANSFHVARRIEKIYGRGAQVIYPPVDVERFNWQRKKEDFYLTVSRLVPYKRVDLIVSVFRKNPDRKLVVIGDGPDLNKIKELAGKNVEILGYQKEEVVKEYYEKAKAFIFAAEEDFGIAPVEAQAAGTPVIAYAKGGVKETVKEGVSGLFFHEQNEMSLREALDSFERKDSFDRKMIRNQAEQFKRDHFCTAFKEFVENKYREFK